MGIDDENKKQKMPEWMEKQFEIISNSIKGWSLARKKRSGVGITLDDILDTYIRKNCECEIRYSTDDFDGAPIELSFFSDKPIKISNYFLDELKEFYKASEVCINHYNKSNDEYQLEILILFD